MIYYKTVQLQLNCSGSVERIERKVGKAIRGALSTLRMSRAKMLQARLSGSKQCCDQHKLRNFPLSAQTSPRHLSTFSRI